MKKNIKYFKRWMALLLAVVLVAGTCVYSSSGSLRATDGVDPMTEEAVSDVTEEETEPEVVVVSEGDETEPEEGEAADNNMPEEEPAAAEGEESTGKTEDAEEVPSEDGKTEEETTAEEKTENEKAEEKTEEKLQEELAVEMPAQTLRATAEDGATVKVSAPEDALPKGATVTISVVTDKDVLKKFEDAAEVEGKVLTGLKAYDVTIWDADGNEIQPDKKVEVTISNTGMDGDDATVFHADDENAPVKKVKDIDDANNATFDAQHFSVNTIITYDLKVLATYADEDVKVYERTITEQLVVELDEYKSLEGETKYGDYRWESNDPGTVEIKIDTGVNYTFICGKKLSAEPVTVTLYKGDKKVAIFNITVESQKVGPNPVYVYIKISGMENGTLTNEVKDKLNELGLKVNEKGWCTVGKLPEVFIDKPGDRGRAPEQYRTNAHEETVSKLPSIEYYRGVNTANLHIEDVDWSDKDPENEDDEPFGLWAANGANDYADEAPGGQLVWHLNGYLDVSKVLEDIETYTVKYVDVDTGKEIISQKEGKAKIGTEIFAEKEKNEVIDKIDSKYVYQASEPETSLKIEKSEDGENKNTLILYYKEQKSKVKITKSATDEKGNTISTAKAGDTICYTIEVENTGDLDITDLKISDIITGINGSSEITDVKINGETPEKDCFSREKDKYIFVIDKLERVGNSNPNKGSKVAKITYTYKVQDEDAGTVIKNIADKENPEITLEGSPGEVTVTIAKKVLTVKAKELKEIYNGKEYNIKNSFINNEVEIPGKDFKGISIKDGDKEYYVNGVTAEAKGTDAGSYKNKVTVLDDVKVFDGKGEDVTSRFEVKGEDSAFTIDKKRVVLKTVSLEKEFDGEPLTNEDIGEDGVTAYYMDGDKKITVTEEEIDATGFLKDEENWWVEDEKVEYNFTGSVTYPNESQPNRFTWELENPKRANNYQIIEEPGTLSISNRGAKYDVTVRANGATIVYDGKLHIVEGFENETEKGIQVTAGRKTYYVTGLSAHGEGTDAYKGGYPVNPSGTAVVKDEAGNVVTNQFNVEILPNQLTIDERVIEITAGSSTHKYTGDKFTVDKSEITSVTKLVDKQFYKATYSGSQQLVGESESKVENIWIYDGNEDVTRNYKIDLKPGKIIVTDGTDTDKVDEKLIINKTAKQTSGYEVGSVVKFTISIKNIFSSKQDVILEELPGVQFDKYEDDATWFEKLVNGVKDGLSAENQKTITIDPGEIWEGDVFYRITEKDIINGEFVNKATVKLGGKTYEAKCDVKTVEPNGHIKITKTKAAIRDAEGNIVSRDPGLGDIIEYNIQVENKGNLVMKNVVLTDELPITFIPNMLDGGRVENGKVVFDELGINGHKKITVQYKVTESDILRGSVTNVATATAEVPEGAPDPTIEPGTVTTDTADPNGHITLTKHVLDPKAEYAFGATVQYKIEATNDGNVTVENLVVEDERTGNTVENGNAFTIAKIEPGETLTVGEVSYTIAEEDIKAPQSKMTNIATGTGKTGVLNPDTNTEIPVIVEEGKADVTVEKDRPSLSIVKTADKTTDVKPGDVITYTITVTNNGNVTINNIMAEDALTGKIGENALINNGTLAPRESKTFTETYEVTEKDILAGKVVNTATVKGDNTVPGGENPEDEASVEIPTAAIDANYMVEKFVQNPQAQYRVGNTISYTIMVKNLGNVSLENVVVEDQLRNATGRVTFTTVNGNSINEIDPMAPGTRVTLNPDNTVTIAALAPGEEVILNCQYTVVRADAGRNIQNAAVVNTDPVRPTGPDENPNPIDPGEEITPEVPANVENIYDLIIHYVYADGTTAAPDVTGQYLEGETYGYASPTIAGYTPNYAFMRSDANGMPARRVELTVTYTAIPGTPTTPTPTADTPTTTPVPPTPIVVVPGTTTPVPTPAPVLIGEEEVPLGGEVALDDNGDVTVVPVEDEEVPLANRDLDDHACCLFHFLLAVATIIIYAFFTKSMKKRQARVNELKDQLETELLKRKLGIADDKDQTV